jgi:hypothetical protein
MAPNVKSMGRISRHLSLLDLSSIKKSSSYSALSRAVSDLDLQHLNVDDDESEFLTLTHPDEECKHQRMPTAVVEDNWGWDETEEYETQTPCQVPARPQVEANYWDWSEEQPSEPVDVLSLSNIESNLISHATRNLNITSETNQVACNDHYWANQAEEKAVTKPQHEQASTGYWQWTAEQDSKKEMIKNILLEETARQQVSIESIERSLINTGPLQDPVQVNANNAANDQYWSWVSPVHASHVGDKSHPVANYWDWESETTTSPIASIMEYERARKMLSVEHLVLTLLANPVVEEQRCEPESNAYWEWSETLGDDYWDAPLQPAVTTGYWDM